MNAIAPAGLRYKTWHMPGWVPAVLLLFATVASASAIGSASRVLFIAGCGYAGYYAWRQNPGSHLQAAIILFAFAPFARRLVDLTVGYDKLGIMLVGPLLAILVPATRLLRIASRPRGEAIMPVLLVGACAAYATVLTLLQGDWTNAASGTLKWFAPLLYAAVLMETAELEDMVHAASSAFLVILPIVGLYGIFQYVNPPEWDQYWMQFAPITSVGYPIPFGVRTFSTMNGPASFATFTAIGLLFVCFMRSRWISLVVAAPAAVALLLTQYRTAWILLAAGILFSLLFSNTRRTAVTIVFGIAVFVLIAATMTPFSDVITERLASLGEGSQDGSAQERLGEFATLWSRPDGTLFGVGYNFSDVGSAGVMPVDGMLIECWLTMGIFVGLFCLFGVVSAAILPIFAALKSGRREAIMVGALCFGALAQVPLADIASGEIGFLFWTFAVLRPSSLEKAGQT